MFKFFRISLPVLLLLAVMQLAAAQPKYVFLFIGDGMGPTIRNYYFNQYPDSILEQFPVAVQTGTDNYQGKTTDSAASGTAIACSIKTYNGAIGVLPDRRPVTSLAKIFRDKGYAVGIITSVGLNDATPAAHFANRLNRRDAAGTLSDLMASNFDFFAGGALILPKEYDIDKYGKLLNQVNYTLVKGNEYSDKNPTKRVVYIGKMAPDWPATPQKRHILSDVTAFAAKNLAKNPKGFFMMIEGGEIDHRAHNNDLAGTMREMREFDHAIRAALDFAKQHPEETLIVITSDHDTGGLNLHKLAEKTFWQKQLRPAFEISRDFVKRASKQDDEKLIAFLVKEFGLGELTAAEKALLVEALKVNRDPELSKKVNYRSMYGKYNPVIVQAMRIRDARHGVSWTHFSHTSRKVITNAKGPGQEYFKQVKENSDVSRAISKAVFGEDVMTKANATTPMLVEKASEEYFNFISLTPRSALFRYGQNNEADLEITLTGKDYKKSVKAAGRYGRVAFDNLTPGAAYTVKVLRGGKVAAERTATLPVAEGKLIGKFALIADAHISLRPDLRYGRLFSCSKFALNDAFKACAGLDFIAMPGDVTDAGTPGEIAIVKAAVEENPKSRILAVPGNHDYMTHKAFAAAWSKLFGAARIEKYGKIQLLMLDTWNGKLTDKKSNLDAIAALDEKSPVIVFSHHQLTPDTFINDDGKIIKDTAEAAPVLAKLAKMNGMIFVGHKNVATTAKLGNMVQLNLPQLTQFPAGYLVCSVYSDGILTEFRPGLNEFYDEYSRIRGSNFKMTAERRDKHSLKLWNKFYKADFSAAVK